MIGGVTGAGRLCPSCGSEVPSLRLSCPSCQALVHADELKRLAEVAGRDGVPAHLVDDAGELDLAWLAGARRIGVSAGASAPPHLVDDLVATLSGLGPVTVETTTTGTEDIRFTLPKEVS